MFKYPVTESGFRLNLGYLGYFEVLEWSHDLEELHKKRLKLRRQLIKVEDELTRLKTRSNGIKTDRIWRRGHSVLSFYNSMSVPTSRPRTRQSDRVSEPVRPRSTQPPVREKSAVNARPSSRQANQRPSGIVNKKDSVPPPRKDVNLDQAYKENFGPGGETKPLWYPESETGSGKMQAPILPNMRLQRETTSFGVYSNLSAHNRNGSLDSFAEETLPSAEGTQLKVLEAIKRNDTAQVRFILDSNPKLQLECSDETGDPVIHCAVKTGNTDIVKLLLDRNVSLETQDKDGRNVLHMAAAQGCLNLVDVLLKSGVAVNSISQINRRTSLHEAILGCHGDVVELLLLRGINPEIKDKTGKTAPAYCGQTYTRREYDKTLSTVAATKIDIEQLHRSGVTQFTNTSIAIDTNGSKLAQDPIVICKRQGADQCGLTFNLQETDDVTSDVIMYKFDQPLKGSIPVVVSLPVLYAPRSSKEELKIKTQDGQTLSPTEILQQNNSWQCLCQSTLGTSGAFVVVCRPVMEEFEVGKENKVVTLAADYRVKVSTVRGAFDKPTIITIQVIEPSDDTEIEENEVLSSTPFYKIQASVRPSKPVTVELPIPDDYGQQKNSKVVILTQSVGHHEWQVVDNTQTKSNSSVTFTTKEFPMHAIVVRVIPSYTKEVLSTEINNIFKQMVARDSTISFLCMSRRSIKTNKFNMVVECCEMSMIETRRRVWTSKGYVEQRQKEPLDQFPASPKQAFNVVFYDNIVTRKNKRADILRYHPKRDSAVMFELADDVPLVSARIFVFKTDSTAISGHSVNADDVVENRKDLLKSIDVMKVDFVREKTVLRPDVVADTADKGLPKTVVFLTDSLIDELIVQMDTEWYKICILMGVSFRLVENSLVIEGRLKQKIKELIQSWRNEKQRREDAGLPLLNSALFKGGRRDIANNLQIDLRKWHEGFEDKDDAFYKWVSRAYKDSDLLVPADYPKPMSDEYLVLMAEELSPSRQLAKSLGLTDTETDDILHSDSYLQDGIRVMKMLTLFRDMMANRIDSLQRLVGCLEELGYEKMQKYSIMCAKAWLRRTATRKDDPLRYQVDAYLKKIS